MSVNIRVHKCDVCGCLFRWDEESSVYGSAAHEDIGARQFVVCSFWCKAKSPSVPAIERLIGRVTFCGHNATLHDAHWEEWDERLTVA